MLSQKEMMKRMMERAKERGVELFREDTVEGLQPQEIEEKASEDYTDAMIDREYLICSMEQGVTLDEWIEQEEAIGYMSAEEEIRVTRKDALYEIVIRNLAGQQIFLIEPNAYGPEFLEDGEKVALGIKDVTPGLLMTWKMVRVKNWQVASICTRTMPGMIALGLRQRYGFDLDECWAMCDKLLLFGTSEFGRKDINPAYELPHECLTPKYICYAPGELDAILSVAAEMLQDAREGKTAKDPDMKEFTRRLQEKASGISPTPDIVLYGRHLNGCGLNEYDSAVRQVEITKL